MILFADVGDFYEYCVFSYMYENVVAMKRLKIGLLPRIIIAIALGIGLGNWLPMELVRGFVTFNGIFGEFLGFIIPLIIVGLVTPAIADIGKGWAKCWLLRLLSLTVRLCLPVFWHILPG